MATDELALSEQLRRDIERRNAEIEKSRLRAGRAQQFDQERASRILNASQFTGLPPEVVDPDLDNIERSIMSRDFDIEAYKKRAPAWTSYLAENPYHMAALERDMESMGYVERSLKQIGMGWDATWAQVEMAQLQNARIEQNGIFTPEQESRYEEISKLQTDHEFGAEGFVSFLVKNAKMLGPTLHSMQQGIEYGLGGAAVGAGSAAVVGQAGPQVALPEEVLTVPAAALVGFNVGAATGAGKAAFELERGFAYGEYRESGMDHETAQMAANTVGAVNASLELVGIAKAVKYVPWLREGSERVAARLTGDVLTRPGMARASATAALRFGEVLGTEVLTEAMQESVTMAAGEVFGGDVYDLSYEMFVDRVAETALETMQGAFLISAVGPGMSYYGDLRKAHQAQKMQSVFETLAHGAANSTTRQKNPGAYTQFVQRLREQGATENVYIDAERFVTYFQENGRDPDAVAAEAGIDVRELQEAQEIGGDVAIPVDRYAEKIAPTPAGIELAPDLKGSVDAMSAREAEMWRANNPDIVEQIEKLAAESQDAAVDAQIEQVVQDVTGQLVAAGFETGAAGKLAQVMRGIGVMARRMNMDPQELYDRVFGGVRRISPEARAAQEGVDVLIDPMLNRLRDQDLPSQREMFGLSLMDFIDEAGGINPADPELAAMDFELGAQELGVSKTKLGRWKDEGGTLVDIAEQAAEQGYIASRDENLLIEGLRRELAGEPVYGSTDAGSAGLRDLSIKLNELASFIEEAGLELDSMTNEEVREALAARDTFEQGTLADIRDFQDRKLRQLLDQRTGLDTEIRALQAEYADLSQNEDMLDEAAQRLTGRRVSIAEVTESEGVMLFGQMMFNEQMRSGFARGILGVQGTKPKDLYASWQSQHDALIENRNKYTGLLAEHTDIAADIANIIGGPDRRFQQSDRGSITFDELGKATINLFEAADFSTFIHEAGHLYLEIIGQMAEQAEVTDQVARDWKEILGYLKVEDRSQITREHHELWARSFEKYAMEGKAPSIGLQDAFNAFRRWLGEIYRRIASVRDVALPDEIRQVMDRMLATDTEIQLAENRQEMGAIFQTAEEMDVSPETFAVYERSLVRAHNEQVQAETVRLLSEMKRDQKAWYQQEQKKVEAKVRTEVYDMKVYRAISMLTRGKQPDGSPTRMAPFKIDRQSLLDLFQGDRSMLRAVPHTGQYGIYRKQGGVDVDVAAQTLGYIDGRALIEAILKAAPMEDVIRAETIRRMQATYPDPFKDGTLADAAVNRVHNERRAQILAAEMRKLRELQRRDLPIVQATKKALAREEREERDIAKGWIIPKRAEVAMIKEAAKRSIGQKLIRNVNPNAYLNAERKAGRLAFEAATKKDYPTAYMYKRMQLVNHEMYRAAVRAKDRAGKTQKYLTKFESTRVQQRLGRSEVLDKILSVLEGVDFRRRSLRSVDRQNLERELTNAVEDGELVMPPGVLQRIFDERVNWQELTVDELEAMRDLIKQLEKQARAEVEAIVNGEKVDIERRANEVSEQLYDNNKTINLGVSSPTFMQRAGRSAQQGVAAWLRPSSIARILDSSGFGAVTRNIIVPMRRAYSERLIPGLHKAQADVSEIYRKHYDNHELRVLHHKSVRVEAQNETYSRSDLLSLALNWGNEGNRQAVMGGQKRDGSRAFSEAGVRQMLAQLTEKDWAFVQEVWDYLETYWPDLRDAERRRRGIAPQQVEALPFTIRTVNGAEVSLRGGYYPLKYASEHSDRVKLDEYQDHYKNMGNGVYVTANTRAGSTYERVRNHGRVVRLSLNVLDTHLREIVRDIAIGDEVNYLKRLLANKELRNAFHRTNNEVALDTLNLWLTDAAVGELPAEGFWEGTTAWIRTGFTKAKLGWNLMTTMLQFTGWTQSMAVIGSKNMAIGLGKFMRNPKAMWTEVMETSKFLNARYEVGAWDKDVQDTRAHLESFFGSTPTRLKVSMNYLAHTYFLPIAKAQQVVDITTWIGAYEKGINEMSLNETDAVIYADTQVEASQTSGFFSDRSGLERGTLGMKKNRQSQYIRIWTTLISYMLAKGNIAYEKTRSTNFRKPSEVLAYFTDLVLLYTVEGIASALLYSQFPEDDEDMAKWVGLRTLDSIQAGIPFVREIASSKFSGGNTPLGAFAHDLYDLGIQIEQGEPDAAMRRALYNVTGTALHIPSGQLGRTLESIWFEDDPNWYEYISGVRDEQ